MSKRLPRVEAERSVVQALLVRLYSKKIRVVVKPGRWYEPEHPNADDDGYVHGDVAIPRAMKGAKDKWGKPPEVSADEQHILLNHMPQIKTMLRYDWAYGKELIRDVYATITREYKPARGSDLSGFEELMQKGLDRLEKENMHGLWFYLDQALRVGIEICEKSKELPELHAEEGAEAPSIPLGR